MASNSSNNLWVLLGLSIAGIVIMTAKKLKKTIKEDFGAFIERIKILPPPPPAPPKAPHPLTGLNFAVSDVFDIDGYVTGFGNPDWAKTHEAATRTSPVISSVVEGGATCNGKTVVDEMALSISGVNKSYDTPTNPSAPAHIPGGASSGSAVAVAAQLVDFSLGIDTAGGVRVPASFCGIFGFRSSQGALSNVGLIPVAPSLDAVGWFAKDPSTLRRVGHVLLRLPYSEPRTPRNIIVADDCFGLLKTPISRVAQVVTKSVEKLFGKQVLKHENLESYLGPKMPSVNQFHTNNRNGELKNSALKSLGNAMLYLQRYEFASYHGEWFHSTKPVLDPATSSQFQAVESSEGKVQICQSIRNEMRAAVNSLVKDDGILVIPTVAGPPPKLGSKEIISEEYQSRNYSLLSIASMSGCCQVSIPLGVYENCPVSVSFLAKQGNDRFLLDIVQKMYSSLQEQIEIASKAISTSRNTITQEESAEIAKEKGNAAFKEKKWAKAVGFYGDAIKHNSENATYYSNRAAAYLELGSFVQAEADCSKAISLDKKNVKSYLRRGTAREMLGYYKEAIEDFRYALVLEPTNKRASLSADRLKKLFQ
ncbi:amidase [Ranunculus cassubicifolius]